MKLLNQFNIYQLVIGFLLSLYFMGIFSFGIDKVVWQAVPAILSTTMVGFILDYFELKRWVMPKTPFITGLIIGLVAQFGANPLILMAIGLSAMLIKFFLKWDGRHIFNPAASGLFLGMILLSSYPSWWVGGELPWIFLIWIPILLLKFKRWAPMVGFLLPMVLVSGLTVLLSSSLLFFMSVMLIEPKTSPADAKIGLIYGVLVALCYLIIGSVSQFDPLIPSLLMGNLIHSISLRPFEALRSPQALEEINTE